VKRIAGHRGARLLYLCLFAAGVFAAGGLFRLQVLKVGNEGPCVRVSEGDVISLQFTHSMYGVPVEERLRVEGRRMMLFHVVTSDAALEYYGIEGRGEGNARREIDRFSIPRESVGGQTLTVRNRRIVLRDLPEGQGSVVIRLAREPILFHVAHCIRR
jgi:hypothetical protein